MLSDVKTDFQWTTPQQAERDELAYWRSRPIFERLAAVEEMRRRAGVYDGAPDGMDRVARFVEIEPRPLPHRGRIRGGGKR